MPLNMDIKNRLKECDNNFDVSALLKRSDLSE